MKFTGFIGPSYTLPSVNVDSQACVNLYPEVIESGTGKAGQVAYLKSTPGLRKILEVGDGPIRLIHVDSIGRAFVVSGNELYRIGRKLDMRYQIRPNVGTYIEVVQSTGVDPSGDLITHTSHGFYTGMKARVSSSSSLPGGLSELTDYWVISLTANTFQLASSFADAIAGTEIDISSTGSGTMEVDPVVPDDINRIDINTQVNFATGTFNITNHGFFDGLRIIILANFPSGNIGNVFVMQSTANSFRIAATNGELISGDPYIWAEPDDEWFAQLCNQGGEYSQAGGDFTFDTSSGLIRAVSMSFAGDGTDSSTLFVDGVKSNVYYETGDRDYLGALSAFGYSDVPTATSIEWVDGYFIVNEGGTNKFWVSELASFNIDALSFASSEGDPDILLAVIANHRDLWMFNEKTIEIFTNTGNADFPFERIAGGFMEVGLLAQGSVAKIDGTLFWLGRSKEGQGIVYSAKGMHENRISTHAIEHAIAGYSNPSGATAFAYQSGGHSFYVLNFDEATWVYDLKTGLWHERAYTGDEGLERHRANTHAFSSKHGLHFVGDVSDNRVYVFDDAYYSDDTAAITRLRSSPHVSAEMNLVFCSRFQLDMETGVGLASGQGSDPQVMLDWSDDGGHTWSDESWTSAGGQVGGIGEYKTRVAWRRLGKFRDRVFRVKITDPVPVTLIDAHLDLEVGGS